MEEKIELKKNQNQILVKINPKLYPLEAVYGACYVFLDKAYVFLDGDPKKEIKVFLKGKEKLTSQELEGLAGEFSNELLNYALRNEISKRNQKIREYIVGQALFFANPEEFEEDKSFEEDPLGIAIPWEEKHTTKKKTKRTNKKKK